MFHIDKLQNLHLISSLLQQICPDGICQQRRHPLFDQPVFQHRLQQLIFNLTIYLMLTTWYRQNDLCSPAHCFIQSIIGRRITGMQRHHHVHMIHAVIIRDITSQKCQLLIAVILCQLLAVCDYICLEIQPDDPYIIVFQLMQIIIHGKCQIGFSTSEIYNNRFPVFWKLRNNIFNKF